MEMQQVRYFLAVAQTLNFTRAAEQCNVSQPALTRAIKQLEDELGGELIRRERRLSHLTSLGEEVLPLLEQCFDSVRGAKLLAKSISDGETAVLKVALSPAIGIRCLLPLLDEIHRAFPGVQFKLRRGSSGDIATLLKKGEVDLAIGTTLEESWDRFEAWPIYHETLDLIIGHDHRFAARDMRAIEVSMIRDERFLLLKGVDATIEEIDRLATVGINLADAHEIDSERDLEAMIGAGLGIGIAFSHMLRSNGLIHLSCPSLDLPRTIAVHTVCGRRRSRETVAMLNLLRSSDLWQAQG